MYGKFLLLAIYVLAIVGTLGYLPPGSTTVLQWLSVGLLAAHVLEVPIAWGSIRKHRGPLIDSIALTLLFGFLHWLPLKNQGA